MQPVAAACGSFVAKVVTLDCSESDCIFLSMRCVGTDRHLVGITAGITTKDAYPVRGKQECVKLASTGAVDNVLNGLSLGMHDSA